MKHLELRRIFGINEDIPTDDEQLVGIYAHGKLEEYFGFDMVYVNFSPDNGDTAFTSDNKEVVFYIYETINHRQKGIVVYVDDEKANEYGKEILNKKPALL